MKKQFFYAAMAIAFMASCTSDDTVVVDPVNPTPEEEKVALELGVVTPKMTAGSRAVGTGTVGSVENETVGDISWNSQELFITMVKKGTTTLATENGSYIFKDLTFRAPSATAAAADKNDIRIYTNKNGNDYSTDTDRGELQHCYYPIVGQFDFYGYHVDNAATNGGTLSETDLTVTGITIDGTHDIMTAKTLAITAENNYTTEQVALANEAFSAKSARNDIKPILKFDHKLARLKFYVRSGKGSDAAINYIDKEDNDQEKVRNQLLLTDQNHQYYNYSTGAIYVTDIKVLDMYQNISLNLVDQTATAADATLEDFTLYSKDDSHTDENDETDDDKYLEELIPVAPEYAYGHSQNLNGEKATPIGDAIMFLPVEGAASSIKIQVQLGQCLIDTEVEAEDPNDNTYTYKWDTPDPVTLTLNASSITNVSDKQAELSQDNSNNYKFLAGESYNVYITIYGRERIEISAELTPWVDGGDIETDIESGYGNDENTGTDDDDTQNP